MIAALLLGLSLHQAPLVTESKCDGFSVVVTSPSGMPYEDDGRVEVKVGDVRFSVPFQPAMFTGVGERSFVRSKRLRCQAGLVAWEVGPQRVVLALSRSGRPGLDRLSLALIDLAKRQTLTVLDTPYEIASGRTEKSFTFVTREAVNGFDVRVVREWLRDDDTLTGAIEDWLAVRVTKQQLTAAWLPR